MKTTTNHLPSYKIATAAELAHSTRLDTKARPFLTEQHDLAARVLGELGAPSALKAARKKWGKDFDAGKVATKDFFDWLVSLD